MDWYKSWILKAREHRASADILFSQGKLRDAISRYYYSAFSIMVAVCGQAPKGRWEHKGILKYFFKWCKENGINLPKEDRELLSVFYDKRRTADYTTEVILLEEVKAYTKLVERLFEVVDGWRKNNT
ncbi:HEPN domain-containing protein [Phorcysia thermohydrogeniphila]|uniref:Uncharacterized protein (UPF0332 family) n=1 Tax=Phorcysia thermohydrogeniphila TaxID=936138 RepID=A0A4R1GCW5_9BACT|nr:HEPN domain-containing protein [Phorcysia thermohydrogeniphila]TCK04611.1 uncharacterized protein (UPF0332 family) [Phorcysia thermohydrogeniphila]